MGGLYRNPKHWTQIFTEDSGHEKIFRIIFFCSLRFFAFFAVKIPLLPPGLRLKKGYGTILPYHWIQIEEMGHAG
jgi:hypothetical protein